MSRIIGKHILAPLTTAALEVTGAANPFNANGTAAVLILETINYQSGITYNVGTGEATIITKSLYDLTVNLSYRGAAGNDERLSIIVKVNGTPKYTFHANNFLSNDGGGGTHIVYTGILPGMRLDVSNIVTVEVQRTNGGDNVAIYEPESIMILKQSGAW